MTDTPTAATTTRGHHPMSSYPPLRGRSDPPLHRPIRFDTQSVAEGLFIGKPGGGTTTPRSLLGIDVTNDKGGIR